jgi:hypothetical protein
VLKISLAAPFSGHFLGCHFKIILLSGHFLQKFCLRRRLSFIFCSCACPGDPKMQAARAREDLNPALSAIDKILKQNKNKFRFLLLCVLKHLFYSAESSREQYFLSKFKFMNEFICSISDFFSVDRHVWLSQIFFIGIFIVLRKFHSTSLHYVGSSNKVIVKKT